ncbi:DUF5820 family protein [Halobellus clavatus]|jgi:hypothetical protein|uniref:Uncharacterized protein n=1 Tax=Halobellus clavatus TaxID=660517 RepID=A0A1H3F6T5_9EURY|nr:DUF5820 family protein [Halobellus clavatus]SDX85904.1 hypothetical protein SAMN04487946_103145 [Halobellus clavatus]
MSESPDESPADEPPGGWTLWNDEPRGRRILVFRPDVFNEQAGLPAECLPTILISNRSRAPRPGASRRPTSTWHVVLTLEPEVEAVTESYDSRDAAIAGANDLARRFATGAVDYRDAYQIPREAYFERLDEVTGPDA